MQSKKYLSETVKRLDIVVPLRSNSSAMARLGDVMQQIKAALVTDAKRLKEISAEMENAVPAEATLAEAHNRYLALQREARNHEESAHKLIALVGNDAYFYLMRRDDSAAIGEEIDIYPRPAQLREKAALWQHVSQYLRFVPEAQIGEIVAFLDWVEITTTKQAIESAIHTHSKMFNVKKRGREKFISLK